MSRDFEQNYPSLNLRAGALPFQKSGNAALEVLLVRRRGQHFWSLPKGRLMPPLQLHEVASVEAFEEAGVEGQIRSQAVGSFLHSKQSNTRGSLREVVEVVVFPLAVETLHIEWPEMEMRERRWFEHRRAVELVGPGQLRALLREFANEFELEC